MANKSKRPDNSKKPGRTLKEQRALKQAKQEAKTEAHKAWDK